MSEGIGRRGFLGLAAAGAAAWSGIGTAGIAAAQATAEEQCRVVVIGSGIGGAIAAFRLAQAGVRIIVLERGRRWPITAAGDTFPTSTRPDQRVVWLGTNTGLPWLPGQPASVLSPFMPVPVPRFAGILDAVPGAGGDVICGAGVGGTSLVYAGMLPQPTAEAFSAVFPGQIHYEELARDHYPRALRRLHGSKIPDDILRNVRYTSTRTYLRYARDLRAGTIERLNLCYDWDIVRAELAGKAVPSVTVGEYLWGANSGAKLSVDRTYLAQAEASGHVEVRPLHIVTDVRVHPQGGYAVECQQIQESGKFVQRVQVRCHAVVFAAGATHTPELLVRARETGTLPDLNEHVGTGFGTNGDRFTILAGLPDPTLPRQAGPPSFLARDYPTPYGSISTFHVPLPMPFETRSMVLLGMGKPNGFGTFVFNAFTGQVERRWPADADRDAGLAASYMAGQLIRAAGGGTALDTGAVRQFTVHPVGGAVLGTACDLYGRLAGHRGLYCLDGSLLPGSTGLVNPALTIAAIVERCLDTIIATDAGTVF